MADIIKIDLTDVQDTLQGTFQTSFQLTDYSDSATLELAAGRTEEINSFVYRVESGDVSVVDGVSNGTAYVYVSDDGDGTATASLSNTPPTFDPNKGGYYNGNDKCIFRCVKATGPTYSNKQRIMPHENYSFENDIYVQNNLDVNGNITSGDIQSSGNIFANTSGGSIGGQDCNLSGNILYLGYIRVSDVLVSNAATGDDIFDFLDSYMSGATTGDKLHLTGSLYDNNAVGGLLMIISHVIKQSTSYRIYGVEFLPSGPSAIATYIEFANGDTGSYDVSISI